ncbi:MAG: hypothetical protein ACRDQZ_07355, partial [Mycobacteriales bacterium]
MCTVCGRRLGKRGQRGPQRTTCRPDHTWWLIEGRKTSCDEVLRGWAIADATRGTGTLGGPPPDLVALAGHVDTLLEPLRLITEHANPLNELLTAIRGQLDSEVATARQEREAAFRAVRAERERRALAEQREVEAVATADEERRLAAEAVETRARAETERDAAVAERSTLHATLQTEIADRQRLQANLEGLAAAKDRIEHEKISLATEVDALRQERNQLRADTAAAIDTHRRELGRLH